MDKHVLPQSIASFCLINIVILFYDLQGQHIPFLISISDGDGHK